MTWWPTESNWPVVTSIQTLPSTVQTPACFCKRPQFSPGKMWHQLSAAKFTNPTPPASRKNMRQITSKPPHNTSAALKTPFRTRKETSGTQSSARIKFIVSLKGDPFEQISASGSCSTLKALIKTKPQGGKLMALIFSKNNYHQGEKKNSWFDWYSPVFVGALKKIYKKVCWKQP